MTPEEIRKLLSPDAFPHAVDNVQLIETYISWVVLTGSYVYKIKKPVNLGFLDFTAIEQREKYCHEELRLNRRTAPNLYLAVVAIRCCEGNLHIGGKGELVDYAVQMKQFDSHALLADHIAQAPLPQAVWKQLAKFIANFHHIAEVFCDGDYGCSGMIQSASYQNIEQIRPFLTVDADIQRLDQIEAWIRVEGKKRESLFQSRKKQGFVRDCHGDLHLGNIAYMDGQVVPFDCIEFNESFRIIDTASEIAFTIMDLDVRGLRKEANRFLNTYLEYSGDYQALQLLNYYKVYRAMVRAKVSLLATPTSERAQLLKTPNYQQYQHYIHLAESYMQAGRPFLAIMHGVSGSGKSWQAQQVAEAMGAVRLRSDVERKRLFGLAVEESSERVTDGGIYTSEASEKTFNRLEDLARQILAVGIPCIVDATFLHRQRRDQFQAVAKRCNVPFVIIDCQTPQQTILERLKRRQELGNDASEADEQIMHRQNQNREALSYSEQQCAVVTDTLTPFDIAILQKRLEK